jgi:hypothetical protein
MTQLLRSLRKLVFGETWVVPLGVGGALLVSLIVRASVPASAWHTAGGFVLAALVAAVLVVSLRTGS